MFAGTSMVKRLLNWRIIWAAVVFGLAMVAFESGTTTAYRVDLEPVGPLVHAYWTLSLFFVAGGEIGMPTGGPVWARAILWFVYFAAPALLISAVIEAVFGAIDPDRWRLRSVSGHTIVAGTGHLPQTAVEVLSARRLDGPIVSVVPPGTTNRPETEADDTDVIVVEDDLLDDDLLDRLRVDRAERVLLLAPHDCANLEVASRIGEQTGEAGPAVIAHVSELGMLRELNRSELLGSVRPFNGHRLAARQLVEQKLRGHFEETGRDDQVVLAGFGKFGQTVLEQLQQRAGSLIRSVVLVDRNVEARSALFDDQVGFDESYDRVEVDGDLEDPRTWEAIDEALEPEAASPVFVLGTPDEDLNLRTAMLQWAHHPEALFVVRSYYHPSLARRMERRGDFEIHNVADLLRSGLDELVERT